MGLPAEKIISFLTVKRKVLTVSELAKLIKDCIEDNIKYVWVEGEISNLYLSKHCYFDLKDADALIKVVMWQGLASKLKFELKDGLKVIVYGRVTTYAPQSKYQVVAEIIEPAGLGALYLQFEELKARLAKEGLFDESRKRSLPYLPHKIAIVTSFDGAVIHDMQKKIVERFPKVYLLLCNVKVQGEDAKLEIAETLDTLNQKHPDTDVIIVGRGGGSIEDLWAFNEEIVARAIARSKIPVISAVGHEIDYTISDFVADVRAKTPTDAATIVVPDYKELLQKLDNLNYKLNRISDLIHYNGQGLDDLSHRLKIGLNKLTATRRDNLDKLANRLQVDLPKFVKRLKDKLNMLSKRAGFNYPRELARRYRGNISKLDHLLDTNISHILGKVMHNLKSLEARLESVNPFSILSRGYSVTYASDGKIIKSASEAKPGDKIISKLSKGDIESTVSKTTND